MSRIVFFQAKKQLTLEQIKNAGYDLPGVQNFKLTNGEYENFNPPIFAKLYEDRIFYGDLDNNGNGEAVVVVTINERGSGDFRYLTVFENKNGQPIYLTSQQLGDRVIINSISVLSDIIVVDMATQGLNDASCCPTLNVTKKYKLTGNQLVDVEGETADWQTYKNETFGYSIRFPDNYEIIPQTELQKSQLGTDNNIAIQTKKDGVASIVINAHENKEGLSVKQFLDKFPLLTKPDLAKEIKLANRDAIIVDDRSNVSYYLINNSRIYEIKIGSPETAEISQMLSTLRFLDEDEIAGWEIYRDEKYGIEFKYPNDWYIQANMGNEGGLIYLSKFPSTEVNPATGKHKSGLQQEVITIGIDKGTYPSIDDWFNQMSQLGLFQSKTEITVGAEKGYKAEMMPGSGTYSIFLHKDGKIFTIEQGTPIECQKLECDTINQILSTFKFLK